MIELLEQCRSLGPPKRHGLEWDLISAQANRAEHTVKAHANGVSVVRFSATGRVACFRREGRPFDRVEFDDLEAAIRSRICSGL